MLDYRAPGTVTQNDLVNANGSLEQAMRDSQYSMIGDAIGQSANQARFSRLNALTAVTNATKDLTKSVQL